MNKLIKWFLHPPVTGSSAILVIRLMLGTMSLWNGVLKFVHAGEEVEKFTRLGILLPHVSLYIVAIIQIAASLLMIVGLFTRIVSSYCIIQVCVAMLTTKISLYSGVDYTELMTCIFLLIDGPGRRSIDFRIYTSRKVYTMGENYLYVAE